MPQHCPDKNWPSSAGIPEAPLRIKILEWLEGMYAVQIKIWQWRSKAWLLAMHWDSTSRKKDHHDHISLRHSGLKIKEIRCSSFPIFRTAWSRIWIKIGYLGGPQENPDKTPPKPAVSLGIGMSGKNVRHQCPAANSMSGGIIPGRLGNGSSLCNTSAQNFLQSFMELE